MNPAMDNHSDDDDDAGAHDIGIAKRVPAGFSFNDDAFSDTEDIEVPEFSPAAIRQELAKNMNGGDGWGGAAADLDLDNIVAKIGYSVDPDASVSTFDIDGGHDSPPQSPPQTPPSLTRMASQTSSHQDSLYDVPLSSEFSHVSLSEEARSPPRPQHNEPEEMVADYPAVQIDMTASEVVTKEAYAEPRSSNEAPRTSEPRSSQNRYPIPHPQHAASHEEFRAKGPPSPITIPTTHVAAASTSALPLPSSSSLPTPTTAKLTEPSTPTTRHRPSKSVGPSMLDKVISKTRPTWLPPKPRAEDQKHLHDWEEMMKRSRAAGECTWSAGRLPPYKRTFINLVYTRSPPYLCTSPVYMRNTTLPSQPQRRSVARRCRQED